MENNAKNVKSVEYANTHTHAPNAKLYTCINCTRMKPTENSLLRRCMHASVASAAESDKELR